MERNFERIQFESLRKKIDPKYNLVHDELTDCYYNQKPFRNYGVLNKEQFDKLHGLIFLHRDIDFHEENLKQPDSEKIPEEKYNSIFDEKGIVIEKNNERAIQLIETLKSEGIELTM